MADLLVQLYELPDPGAYENKLREQGVQIKRALAPDRSRVVAFSRTCAQEDYSDEVKAAFANNPITCDLAVKRGRLLGFACYEATAKDFFGPMAVLENARDQGIGRALLLRSLRSMMEMGDAYAVIGWPTRSAVPFYEKCAAATPVPGASLGVYTRLIGRET